MIPGSFFDQCQWRDFQNIDSTTMPGFGVGIITDFPLPTSDDEPSFRSVNQPFAYGDPSGMAIINGPVDVPAGSYGMCTRGADEVLAAYQFSDGTPKAGDQWGPQPGSWLLRIRTPGFTCLGGPTNPDLGIALFRPTPMKHFRGVANADITPGGVGTARIYFRIGPNSYTDTTYNTATNSVLNDLDATVKGGSVIRCVYEPFLDPITNKNTDGWTIVQAAFTC